MSFKILHAVSTMFKTVIKKLLKAARNFSLTKFRPATQL